VSDSTQDQARNFMWQELDRVRVKGKALAVAIYSPVGRQHADMSYKKEELVIWEQFLDAYRAQDWAQCNKYLMDLQRTAAPSVLYDLYAVRLQTRQSQTFDLAWDDVVNFDVK
jgi:adenylate cyclase